ncbi:Hypothetical predicted protein, partial [Mytilus galloprovincialis]
MDIGQKTVKKGEIQQLPEEHQTKRSPDILKVQNVDSFDSFYDYESGTSCINVNNRLKNSLDFWKNINASKFILDLIENGYKIPLIYEPESVLLRNNKSALEHIDFVEKAVQELIDASLIEEVSNRPHVVNPLTVSINSSVLPFGLCSAGYVFAKVVRPIIAHWLKDGIKITVYSDD